MSISVDLLIDIASYSTVLVLAIYFIAFGKVMI